MPAQLRQAYQDTIDVFNAKVWNATAVCGRRTLEGIVENLVPNQKGPLAKRLENLGQHYDLSKPIIQLAHGIRLSGNVGAHYDLEKEANQELASALLDLIDYLIEYIYTLPGQIGELETRLENLGREVEDNESEQEEVPEESS